MKTKLFVFIGLTALLLLAFTAVALAAIDSSQAEGDPTGTLVQTVRQATERFKDVKEAEAAGYGLFHGCVSGPQEGAMGIHYVNGDLVGDGELDATKPEALIYEFKNNRLQLTGVEYIVDAATWDANHDTPPVLMGQMFNFAGSPNRYRIPAFYELHVWAWKGNPLGTFADWNSRVSCDDYTAGDAADHASH